MLLVCIVLRGLATLRVPWGNMYEFINLTCFCGLVAAAIVLRRPQYRALWVFVLLPVLILLTVSGNWLYTNAAPVMPALQSYWLPIHVSVVSLGSGVFLVAGVASILFLLKMSPLADPAATARSRRIVARLPDAQTLDRIAYRTTIFAFPVFGFGVIFGAIWAEEAWGRYWGWDPKETVAFIAWVVYAAYLHARSTAGWRDKKAAWINVVGFVAMVFNLFFINLVTVGCTRTPGWAELESRWPSVPGGRATRFRPQQRSAIPPQTIPPEWTAPTPPHGIPGCSRRVPAGRDHRPAAAPPPYLDLSTVALLGQPKRGALGGLAPLGVSGVVQAGQRRREPEGHPPQEP